VDITRRSLLAGLAQFSQRVFRIRHVLRGLLTDSSRAVMVFALL
jgi:hypothetical protein